jgi:pimeloyl-ACP methyl ester carboxylesterase
MGDQSEPRERVPSPLEALEVIASTEVEEAPGLRHFELYTMRGLLTVLWHGQDSPGAVVALGGAMGGLLGPGRGVYPELGRLLAQQGTQLLRVSYRRPNDLDACTLDAAAAVQLAVGSGAERVVMLGHSFGGAIAIRAGVVLPQFVTGVATFATQSAGCELAAGLRAPLVLFHGERDELLPVFSSEVVRDLVGHGELEVLPNDGHLLSRSHDILLERLLDWIPARLAVTDQVS